MLRRKEDEVAYRTPEKLRLSRHPEEFVGENQEEMIKA